MLENTGRAEPAKNDQEYLRIIETAITSTLGNIDALPDGVVVQIRDVYREFIPAYLEMIRIRDNRPKKWQPDTLVIEPDVADDMGHFYSDYQHLVRRFHEVNRQVKQLLTLNRKKDPHRYDALVEQIISGRKESTVMSSLFEQ